MAEPENETESLEKRNIQMVIFLVLVVAFIVVLLINTFWIKIFDTNRLLMNSAFFTLIFAIILITWQTLSTGFSKRPSALLYIVSRYLAISAYLYIQMWILLVSPFSIFGGSLYGFFMQLIIAIPLGFILMNFWVNGNTNGMLILIAANILILPLSFSFPTLFSNFYAISTGTSAAAGGGAANTFAVIDPMSYYRSSVLHAGVTEVTIGPTYEEVTDDVIGVEVEIGGRMCDDTDIVATTRLDNEAKYMLSDVWVEFSPIRNVYSPNYDSCDIRFGDYGKFNKSYSEKIDFIAKSAPSTVTTTFQTHLPADVISQICTMRTDVVLSYHSTSVFPLTFIDYDQYVLDPVNIGSPTSISSFGRIRIDMDVGEQPIPTTSSSDTLLLKIGWEQKSSNGIVNNPTIYLFLPPDLGSEGCMADFNYEESGYTEGSASFLGFNYTGSFENITTLESPDFECNLDCSEFETSVNMSELSADPLAAISSYNIPTSNSLNVPGTDSVCEELVEDMGYNLCKTTFPPDQTDILLCMLDISDMEEHTNEIDMTTYLIRADAVYEFHDVTTTSFTVENCDII